MRVNRPSKPPRSIRYELSADRKLQKLSLRRISVPAKKASKARKATRSIRPTIRPKSAVPTTDATAVRASDVTAIRALTPRAVFVGAICVMAAAVLIAARQPFQQTDVASVSAPPKPMPLPEEIALPKPVTSSIVMASSAVIPPKAAAAPAQIEAKKTAIAKPDAVAVAHSSATDTSTAKTTSAESVKAMAEPAAYAPKTDATTTHTAVESTSNAASPAATPVTITGCVENDEETFWLKDTSGADAPKSRNWKSGFLRKRPATIALLDANHALKLPNYVGQRVAATGTLVNREMRAQSLQRVGSSCS